MSQVTNPFDCLGLPKAFDIPSEVLDQAYHKVLRLTHPDRFIGRTGVEKLAASLQASRANEAYQTLKSFYSRARAYLSVMGHPFDEKASPSPAFLMEVMEYQEALEGTCSLPDLYRELSDALKAGEENLKEAFKNDSYETAAEILSQYKYLQRLVVQAEAKMKASSRIDSQLQPQPQSQRGVA